MIRLFKMILDKLKDIYTKIVTIDADTSTINSNIGQIIRKKINLADALINCGFSSKENNVEFTTEKINQTSFMYFDISDASQRDLNLRDGTNKTADVNYINVMLHNVADSDFDIEIWLYNDYLGGYKRVYSAGVTRTTTDKVNESISIDIPIIANYYNNDSRFGYVVSTNAHCSAKVTVGYYTY